MLADLSVATEKMVSKKREKMQKMQTEQSAVHSEHTYKPKEPPLSGK